MVTITSIRMAKVAHPRSICRPEFTYKSAHIASLNKVIKLYIKDFEGREKSTKGIWSSGVVQNNPYSTTHFPSAKKSTYILHGISIKMRNIRGYLFIIMQMLFKKCHS